MSYATIQNYNGEPAIMFDGNPYPPMAMTTMIVKPEYLEALGKSKIKKKTVFQKALQSLRGL